MSKVPTADCYVESTPSSTITNHKLSEVGNDKVGSKSIVSAHQLKVSRADLNFTHQLSEQGIPGNGGNSSHMRIIKIKYCH
jgi:hypothetical protein